MPNPPTEEVSFVFHQITWTLEAVSPQGVRQAIAGEIVTSREDRRAIASFLKLLSKSPTAQAAIRGEMLNNKYPENMKHR